MKESIKDWIKTKELLYYWAIFAKQGANRSKRRVLLDAVTSPAEVCLVHLGEENRGRVLCVIDPVNSYASGFYSNLYGLLQTLFWVDQYGLVPVVKCNTNTHYLEQDTSFLNTSNYFEYFFEQPGGVSVEQALRSSAVVFNEPKQKKLFSTLKSEEQSEVAVKMLQRYIQFRPEVMAQLEVSKQRFIGDKRTLGIKYRGTDMFSNLKDHPLPFQPEEVARTASRIFEEGGYERVFLATEDLDGLEVFQRCFGSVLRFDENVQRYRKGMDHVQAVHKANYAHPAYEEGLAVLRDTWVLSQAQGLIGTGSGVTMFAELFNKAYCSTLYEDCLILNKGLRKHGKNSIRYGQKKYGR